jgi:hypothetical protein
VHGEVFKTFIFPTRVIVYCHCHTVWSLSHCDAALARQLYYVTESLQAAQLIMELSEAIDSRGQMLVDVPFYIVHLVYHQSLFLQC